MRLNGFFWPPPQEIRMFYSLHDGAGERSLGTSWKVGITVGIFSNHLENPKIWSLESSKNGKKQPTSKRHSCILSPKALRQRFFSIAQIENGNNPSNLGLFGSKKKFFKQKLKMFFLLQNKPGFDGFKITEQPLFRFQIELLILNRRKHIECDVSDKNAPSLALFWKLEFFIKKHIAGTKFLWKIGFPGWLKKTFPLLKAQSSKNLWEGGGGNWMHLNYCSWEMWKVFESHKKHWEFIFLRSLLVFSQQKKLS